MIEFSEKQNRLRRSIAEIQKEYGSEIRKIDISDEIPEELFKVLKNLGILSFMVPLELGGEGGDTATYCLIIEELAKISGSLSLVAYTQMSSSILLQLGECETQKRKYLLRQVKEDKFIVAAAMTEPNAGSDLSAIETKAIFDGNHYVLNGHKCFISNGSLADIFLVFAKTESFQDIKDILIFIVEKGMEGVGIERNEIKLGMKGSPLSALSFEDVKLTPDYLLAGGRADRGLGFKRMMGGLNVTRLGAGAVALGLAQAAIDSALEFIKAHEEMDDLMAGGQAVQFMLANGEAQVEAIRALIYRTAGMIDKRKGNLLKAASIAKYFATETAMEVASNISHIFRAHGTTSDYPIERILRDLACTLILDGTNQVHQMIIARELLKYSVGRD
jgi:alkylation response protein AidB-like acyl-CoA dehydrogenase